MAPRLIVGLLLSAACIYALITYLGQQIGLALTLAGVTGIIVSIGVTVDSYVGTNRSRMWLQALVAIPAVQNMSFTAIGIPSNRRASPRAIRTSAAAAMLRARSGVSITKALSARARWIADKCASASSTALNSFFASAARASATVRVVRSVMPQSVRSPDSHRSFTLTREILGSRYARPRTAKRGAGHL